MSCKETWSDRKIVANKQLRTNSNNIKIFEHVHHEHDVNIQTTENPVVLNESGDQIFMNKIRILTDTKTDNGISNYNPDCFRSKLF